MALELVLLLAIYAFVIMGVFFGSDIGPKAVFLKSGPRLAAKIERNIATGTKFTKKSDGGKVPQWIEPPKGGGE